MVSTGKGMKNRCLGTPVSANFEPGQDSVRKSTQPQDNSLGNKASTLEFGLMASGTALGPVNRE